MIVDDDEKYVKNLTRLVFRNKTVDQYYDPSLFLENISKYVRDTRIYLDNNFSNSNLKGIDIARQLHDLGYNRLYLLSGETFNKNELPDGLIVIRKDDIDGIKDSLHSNK